MKKVLALVLAVLMLSTMAFAATATPGSSSDADKDSGNYVPGKSLKVYEEQIVTSADEKKGPVNSKNYSIGKITYEEGKALVESVKFNDSDDCLVIKLKQDYTQTTDKKLAMTVELKGKRVDRDTRYADVTVTIGTKDAPKTVGYAYDVTTLNITKADSDLELKSAAAATVYKVTADDDADPYGILYLTAADADVETEVRVYEDEKYFLESNTDADKDLLKKYADSEADITFLNFVGTPTFNSNATTRFYKPDDTYVYEMKDGKIVKEVKYNDDEGCFILKSRTLGSYVFSDKKLSVSADTPADTNPDTGANDVVGIATALAAVALVSAAAVSLKK